VRRLILANSPCCHLQHKRKGLNWVGVQVVVKETLAHKAVPHGTWKRGDEVGTRCPAPTAACNLQETGAQPLLPLAFNRKQVTSPCCRLHLTGNR
jgi:hypothetical protein